MERVGEVTQSFLGEGFTEVTCREDEEGTWTITASR